MASTSRREVLQAALTMAAVSSSSLLAGSHSRLPITIAGYKLDRLQPMLEGKVGVEGADMTFVADSIGNMNTDVFSGPQSREVTEIGLHPFMLAWANDSFRDYQLLPVFPLRTFRHKSVFVHADSGIEQPEDLKGRNVGTAGYSSTSLTWIRGILDDEYGVSPRDVNWTIAASDSSGGISGGPSRQENVLPGGIPAKTGPAGMDESDLLLSGEVDALYHAAEPKAYVQGNPKVKRLFTDYRSVEQDYYRRTGIFPIMHAVAIRRDVADEHPWLPMAVYDAYVKARDLNYEMMTKMGWATVSLPWFGQELAETRAVMGKNFWEYGLGENNRKALSALFRYSHSQGLSSRLIEPDEMFHPATLKTND